MINPLNIIARHTVSPVVTIGQPGDTYALQHVTVSKWSLGAVTEKTEVWYVAKIVTVLSAQDLVAYPDLLDMGIVSVMGDILDMSRYLEAPIYRSYTEGLTEAKAKEILGGMDDLRLVYG
jgi:hypothetical protein